MFIELTDHLRCTADHDEAFLVLLPEAMRGRRVARGTLGCPACGRIVAVEDGAVNFGGDLPPSAPTVLTAEAVAALLGLDGPGGYLALLGAAGGLAAELVAIMPGIRLVAINPPASLPGLDVVSVLRSGRHPLKQRSMRGVVIAADHAEDPSWLGAGLGSVLPGNRAVVERGGTLPPSATVIAEAAPLRVVRGG